MGRARDAERQGRQTAGMVRMTDWQEPPGDDWRHFIHDAQIGGAAGFPQDWPRIEIWRAGWDEPQIIAYRDIHPTTNVAGLYWRPMY